MVLLSWGLSSKTPRTKTIFFKLNHLSAVTFVFEGILDDFDGKTQYKSNTKLTSEEMVSFLKTHYAIVTTYVRTDDSRGTLINCFCERMTPKIILEC